MTRLLGTALIVLCTAGVARAELDDNEVSTRLHFIEERLRCAEPIHVAWQMTWTGVYAVGMLVQSGRAVVATDGAERADLVVSQRRFGGERQISLRATVTPQAGGGVLTIRF